MSHAQPALRDGHELRLLEGSVELFPALVADINRAQRYVRLETYIFDLTASGADVAQALLDAARRGVRVQVVVDGFGTEALAHPWPERFMDAGVQWAVYSPPGTLGLLIPGRWRRLHRKLCVVDGDVLYCGGINVLDDFHDPNHGTLAAGRLDFAVRVRGPMVAEADDTMAVLWQRMQAAQQLRSRQLAGALESLRGAHGAVPPASSADLGRALSRAALVLRDNVRHRARIERAYRRAIGMARSEVIIANAYFVPDESLLRLLAEKARHGVAVQVIAPGGKNDLPLAEIGQRQLYRQLLSAGVKIFEYQPVMMHAKTMLIDDDLAVIGSLNLNLLSLSRLEEAVVVVDDPQLVQALDDSFRSDRAESHEIRLRSPSYTKQSETE